MKTEYTADAAVEKCQRHKMCTRGESVILAGSLWHDTICGHSSDFPRITSLTELPSGKTLQAVDRLASLWTRTMPDADFTEMCKHLSPSTPLGKCNTIDITRSFSAERSVAQQLYYTLHGLFLHKSAEKMYAQVIQPFLAAGVSTKYPKIEIQHKLPVEVDVIENTLLVQVVVAIPVDPRLQIKPVKIMWYRKDVDEPTIISHSVLLTVQKESVYYRDPRCEMTNKFRWKKPYDEGFLAYVMDISLIIKGLRSSVYQELQAEFMYTALKPDGKEQTLYDDKDIALKYIWKHKRSPDCTCENELYYTDPTGPCSPTCIPYARVVPGLPDADNDWTLHVSYNHKGLTPQKSRVVHGVTRLNTEIYCLVTSTLFTSLNGPRGDAPAAPVDVMQCDVVLLEFPVKTVRDQGTGAAGDHQGFSGDRDCVAIHVGSQSAPALADGEVCIPTSVNNTLAIIRRQGWTAALGVKIAFQINGGTVNPNQEELSAVLSWLSTTTSAVQTVVVDMNVEHRGYVHFDAVSEVYGSRFDLKPGFTSSALSRMMTIGDVPVNTGASYFKEGDNVRMGSVKQPTAITSITWKHHNDIVVEWRRDVQKITSHRNFKGRVTVDTETGALEFSHLIASDSGVYTAEIDRQVLPRRYNIIVTPSVSPQKSLREVGDLVARHGVFLELTNIRGLSQTNCDSHNPHMWRPGEYYGEEDLKIETDDVKTTKNSGVYVFDELSRLSNNRAGIIVSLPSAAYDFGPKCTSPATLVNRHLAGLTNTVIYSTRELSAMVVDMAKWGVAKYGLGYLDYTFVRTNNMPTFSVLANAIGLAADRYRVLRYSYARDPAFGDGGYSAAQVNGIYKLEAGMFFRQVSSSSPRVKSFVSIPGVPELELGLSSEMNVGSSLSASVLSMGAEAKLMAYVPYGAKTVHLNQNGIVVFVDRVREVVCYHVLPKVQAVPIRTPALGVVTNHETNVTALGSGCVRNMPGDHRYVKLALTLPSATEADKLFIMKQMPRIDEPQNPPLSSEDKAWLSVANDTQRYEYRPHQARGPAALYAEMHTISVVLQCLSGYSSCVALANIVENNWPQGGTGYPIALRAFEVRQGVLLKMILAVSHGALRVETSCDLEPFAWSSHEIKYSAQVRGYYQRKQRSPLNRVFKEIGMIQSTANSITRAITAAVCQNDTHGHPRGYKWVDLIQAANCVGETERLTVEGSDTVSKLGKLVNDGDARLRAHGRHLIAAEVHVGALSWVAAILAVLINIVCVTTL